MIQFILFKIDRCNMGVEGPSGKSYTFLNPFSYLMVRRAGLLTSISRDFVVSYDGISLLWARNFLSSGVVSRASFDDTSIAPAVFMWAKSLELKVGIVGSSMDTICRARQIIFEKYGIEVVECVDGYFSLTSEPAILKRFKACDLVICSLGSPKQELFLMKLRDQGWVGNGYTCGGYFDQLAAADGGDYYPRLMNKLNLRWAYRLYKEPRRLSKRYFLEYPLGLCAFFLDRARGAYRDDAARIANIVVHDLDEAISAQVNTLPEIDRADKKKAS
ncbi:WecB/TagA/CpsF family glycosyltransferase [Stutzerimonas tarimensis]|uniref:WecB/TagA/CpsF family glycosyltransferase n=1 Tax=Stutzerimonas tarimensis TaxID=1507735 RepID=A0ABV7T7J3_9GAMM